GPAVDPRSGVIYINANDYAWTGGLTEIQGGNPGAVLYQTQCAICHGGDLAGNPPAFPSLVNIDKRLTQTQIAEVIRKGKGRMPGFPKLTQIDTAAILRFLGPAMEPLSTLAGAGSIRELEGGRFSSTKPKYRFTGYRKFLDPDGYPAVATPWGTLNA